MYWGPDLLHVNNATRRQLIVDKILWEKDVVMLVGDAKVGKSVFALQLCCSITTGESMLDTFDVHGEFDILYVQLEGTREDTQDRLRRMMNGIDCNPDRFTHLFYPDMALDTTQGYTRFRDILAENNRAPKVLVIDPLYMAMHGDMKDSVASKQFIANIRRIKEQYECAVVIVHHTHRQKRSMSGDIIREGDKSYFGSYVWQAFPDHMLMINVKKSTNLFTLTCDTQRSSNVIEKVEFKMLSSDNLLLFTASHAGDTTNMLTIADYIRRHPDGVDISMLTTGLQLSKSTVYNALRVLINNGTLVKRNEPRPVRYFRSTT